MYYFLLKCFGPSLRKIVEHTLLERRNQELRGRTRRSKLEDAFNKSRWMYDRMVIDVALTSPPQKNN